MQLILLSGGSGKRLWPLSNNSRSKQFLPLLPRKDGTMESMVQRVVRQIYEANLTTEITIATNSSQLDIIQNQLGDNVNVVTEPERRDTFPAIALAASYLKLSKHCSDDEVVVVMPCDPFTESGYFEVITQMARFVEQNVADLVLMGITPTYPSEKYGYIVPDYLCCDNIEYRTVNNFTEKPTADKAKELISMGALWNGGVFAFRLGYIVDVVEQYIKLDLFSEVVSRYKEFPKISFDYEVVEKAKSIAVVQYDGQWKDLGTWNAITDEIGKYSIGYVVMGENCDNTHVINELPCPVYVSGLKDSIVAVGPDGILVCNKSYSEGIKGAVESLNGKPMYEEKRWGIVRTIESSSYNDGHCTSTKYIKLYAGKEIQTQVHYHRQEIWTVLDGEGVAIINGTERNVKVGETIVIPSGYSHSLRADSDMTFIEIQSGNILDEDNL